MDFKLKYIFNYINLVIKIKRYNHYYYYPWIGKSRIQIVWGEVPLADNEYLSGFITGGFRFCSVYLCIYYLITTLVIGHTTVI